MATRRTFVKSAIAMAGTSVLDWPAVEAVAHDAAPARKPRIAAVFTEFRFRSHAHVILENCLEPLLFNGKWREPRIEIVAFYADQIPPNDLARETAKKYGIPRMALELLQAYATEWVTARRVA